MLKIMMFFFVDFPFMTVILRFLFFNNTLFSDIEQLITTQGMVVRISPLIPEMRQAHFQCTVCNFPVRIFLFFLFLDSTYRNSFCNKGFVYSKSTMVLSERTI